MSKRPMAPQTRLAGFLTAGTLEEQSRSIFEGLTKKPRGERTTQEVNSALQHLEDATNRAGKTSTADNDPKTGMSGLVTAASPMRKEAKDLRRVERARACKRTLGVSPTFALDVGANVRQAHRREPRQDFLCKLQQP